MLAYAGAASALVAGATGSLHCALMCGPLACAGLPVSGPDRRRAAIAWHLGRIVAYSFVGLLLGALGRGVSQGLMVSVQPVLPWVMAAGLVITALDLARHVQAAAGRRGHLPGPGSHRGDAVPAGAQLPAGRGHAVPPVRAALRTVPGGDRHGLGLGRGGWCSGPSPWGRLPALGAVQLGARKLTFSPRVALVARRVVPLLAAAMLVARALMTRAADVAKCG